MKNSQPSPVTMVILTPEQLGAIVEQAVARATGVQQDEVLTLYEAAEYLKVSPKTMRRMIERGQAQPLQGKPIRFLRSRLNTKVEE